MFRSNSVIKLSGVLFLLTSIFAVSGKCADGKININASDLDREIWMSNARARIHNFDGRTQFEILPVLEYFCKLYEHNRGTTSTNFLLVGNREMSEWKRLKALSWDADTYDPSSSLGQVKNMVDTLARIPRVEGTLGVSSEILDRLLKQEKLHSKDGAQVFAQDQWIRSLTKILPLENSILKAVWEYSKESPEFAGAINAITLDSFGVTVQSKAAEIIDKSPHLKSQEVMNKLADLIRRSHGGLETEVGELNIQLKGLFRTMSKSQQELRKSLGVSVRKNSFEESRNELAPAVGAALEQRHRVKMAQNAVINGQYAAVQILGSLFKFTDPKLGDALIDSGSSIVRLNQAVGNYKDIVEGGFGPEANTYGALALASNYVGVVSTFFSILSGMGSHEQFATTVILGSIRNVQRQMAVFQEMMKDRFDHIDQSLNVIFVSVNSEFRLVHEELANINARLGDIERRLSNIEFSLKFLEGRLTEFERKTDFWFKSLATSEFERSRVLCLERKASRPEDPPTQEELNYCRAVFLAHATSASSGDIFLNPESDTSNPDSILKNLNEFPAEFNLRYILKLLSAKDSRLSAYESQAMNVFEWARGVGAFMELLRSYPAFAADEKTAMLTSLKKKGENHQKIMLYLMTPQGGDALLERLLQDYQQDLKMLQFSASEYIKAYIADNLGGFDLWKGEAVSEPADIDLELPFCKDEAHKFDVNTRLPLRLSGGANRKIMPYANRLFYNLGYTKADSSCFIVDWSEAEYKNEEGTLYTSTSGGVAISVLGRKQKKTAKLSAKLRFITRGVTTAEDTWVDPETRVVDFDAIWKDGRLVTREFLEKERQGAALIVHGDESLAPVHLSPVEVFIEKWESLQRTFPSGWTRVNMPSAGGKKFEPWQMEELRHNFVLDFSDREKAAFDPQRVGTGIGKQLQKLVLSRAILKLVLQLTMPKSMFYDERLHSFFAVPLHTGVDLLERYDQARCKKYDSEKTLLDPREFFGSYFDEVGRNFSTVATLIRKNMEIQRKKNSERHPLIDEMMRQLRSHNAAK